MDPERAPWPSVEDVEMRDQCVYCDARDGEAHEPHCPLVDYEPPDPDGEAFRGGEAAAYEADQQDEARGLK